MCAPRRHDQITSLAWTTLNESILQIINRVIEFSIVEPEASIDEPISVLDKDHAFIANMARIEYVQIHSVPATDLHVSKQNGFVPFSAKHATGIVKIAIIYCSACERCRKNREDDRRPSQRFVHEPKQPFSGVRRRRRNRNSKLNLAKLTLEQSANFVKLASSHPPLLAILDHPVETPRPPRRLVADRHQSQRIGSMARPVVLRSQPHVPRVVLALVIV